MWFRLCVSVSHSGRSLFLLCCVSLLRFIDLLRIKHFVPFIECHPELFNGPPGDRIFLPAAVWSTVYQYHKAVPGCLPLYGSATGRVLCGTAWVAAGGQWHSYKESLFLRLFLDVSSRAPSLRYSSDPITCHYAAFSFCTSEVVATWHHLSHFSVARIFCPENVQ
jgi:hypothetical protein